MYRVITTTIIHSFINLYNVYNNPSRVWIKKTQEYSTHKQHNMYLKTRPRYRVRTSKSFHHLRLELLPPPLSQTWVKLSETGGKACPTRGKWMENNSKRVHADWPFLEITRNLSRTRLSIVSTFPIVSQYPEEVAPGWKE